MQGRLWRRIDMASLDLAVNGEACALARGQEGRHFTQLMTNAYSMAFDLPDLRQTTGFG
jgi:hypothetical protein